MQHSSSVSSPGDLGPYQTKEKTTLHVKSGKQVGHRALGSIIVEQHCSAGLRVQKLKPTRPLKNPETHLQFSCWENRHPSISKAAVPRGTSNRFKGFSWGRAWSKWLHINERRSCICFFLTLQVLPEWSGSARGVTHLTLKL